nr:hypothetical protein [Tanacetum cinerariifolium]
KAEGDEDEGMDYTTNRFNDDVDLRMNEPVNTDEGLIQKKIFPIQMQKSFLQWMFVSIMRVTTLEKEVVELKKNDPLNTQVTALVDEHLDSRLGATRDEFMSYLLASITARITEQVKSQLPQILPKEVSNFALRQKDKHKDEEPSAGSDRGLKKRKTSKDSEPTKGLKTKDSTSGSSNGAKSQSKSSGKSVQSEEPEFEVSNSNMPQDQEENLGNNDEEPKRKVASKCDWFIKPRQPEDPTDPD